MKKSIRDGLSAIFLFIVLPMTFVGLILVATNDFMPRTVVGKVVAYSQNQVPLLLYKTTTVTMVWESISINEGESPISIGEREYTFNGWHEFELGIFYKIYSKGQWKWAHPSIIDLEILPS